MHRSILLMACALSVAPVWGQDDIQRSSHPQGMQVYGNADVRAQQSVSSAVAVGEANTAKNTSGAARGDTLIKGNTRVKAEQNNATATAVGRDNTARNEVGVIGGK